MQYQTLSAAAHQHQRQSHALLGCCGVLVALGVWGIVSATSPVTNAHVQVQPKVTMQVGMVAPGSRFNAKAALPIHPATASSAGARGTAQPALQASSTPMIFTTWLSLTAIIVSVAAAIVNLFNRFRPSSDPEPAATIEDDATSIKKGSDKMDEVAIATKQELENRKSLSPKQVVLELQRGNARFWSGTPSRPEMNAMERRAAIIGQAPSVCILSCADSRVPVEILFDQGLGSVFVVRVAGNILDATAMGSIEFSVKYLGVKVVLVMGHEACGAVKGAMTMTEDQLNQQPEYLQVVLRSIKGNLDVQKLGRIQDNRAQDREAVVVNTSRQVKRLLENGLIASKVADGSILVCGAFYEITSGIVDFFTLDKNGLVTEV